MRQPVLTLLGLSFLTFFLGLGRQAITDADEGFYAEASREMVETGDWLTPRFNYEDRWQKPVLYYWLTAATFLAAGPTEWAARLWSAMSGLGLVLLTWRIARDALGRADVAWLAGAIVATCFGAFAMARMALPDLPLTFCITLTIWAGLERRFALAGLGAGLGFLMKGPVGPVLPALVLLPIWYQQGVLRRLSPRDLAVAGAVFAFVGLPWYLAMTAEHGTPYLESFFVGDNLERFATDRFNERRPAWFYLPVILGGMLPWSAFLAVFAVTGLRGAGWRPQRLDGISWTLLAWAAIPTLFYTLSVGQQPRYVLPVLPPLAVLVARAIATRVDRSRQPSDESGLAIATWSTALLFALMAIVLQRTSGVFVNAQPLATTIGIAALAAAGIVLAVVALTRRWSVLPRVLTTAGVVLLLTVQFGALSGVRPEPVEDMAALVHAQRLQMEDVGHYQVFVRNLGFYTQLRHAALYDEAGAIAFLQSPRRVLLVIRQSDLQQLESASGIHLQRLGRVRYLNTANIRMRTLIEPVPDDELETVLLVANR